MTSIKIERNLPPDKVTNIYSNGRLVLSTVFSAGNKIIPSEALDNVLCILFSLKK